MSNAADRAEARRKAILAKRGDRLAKLTTTARGDEGKTYLNDGVFAVKSLSGPVVDFLQMPLLFPRHSSVKKRLPIC